MTVQAYGFDVVEAVDEGPSLVRAPVTPMPAIAARRFGTEKAVSTRGNNAFTKLALQQTEEDG